MKLFYKLLAAPPMLGLLMIVLTGCSGSSEDAASANNSNTQNKQPIDHKLVGQWTGVMEINEDSVRNRLEESGEAEQAEETIQILKSMQMALSFQSSGEMTMSATVALGEETQETEANGTWSLLSNDGDLVIIKTLEEEGDEEDITLTFEGQDSFSMRPPGPDAKIGVMRFRRLR